MLWFYGVVRVVLVALWLLAGLAAWRAWRASQHCGQPQRVWRWVALLALVLASLRAVRWNYLVLDQARHALRAVGVYDERLVAKIVLAVLLALGAAGLLRAVWRAARAGTLPGPAVVLLVSVFAIGILVAMETFSLDDALPRWLVQQPGRYLFEGACATVALAALRAVGGGANNAERPR